MNEFRAYLDLLRDLSKTLVELTEVEQVKIKAVRQDDLTVLNDCMKQEQVLSMSLRGFEHKRQTALTALQLDGLSLSNLPTLVPEECRSEAKEVSETLLKQYQLFQGVFEVAQNTLEVNLHQIEKHLSTLGADQLSAPGFQTVAPELPSNLRTDFRA